MGKYKSMVKAPTGWLGQIPEHWECKKIGSLFSERKTKVSDTDYPPLSVTKRGIVPQLANAAKSDSGDNRKLVCSGDFVINSRSDRKGSCGVSELDGSVSLINIILTPRNSWNNKYVHYLMRSQPFSEEYYHYGRGIVADLWTTRYSEMKNILLPVPPRSEQDQIVRFLDWKISEINRLINIKKKEIKELEELKNSIISSTVLHGVSDKNKNERWKKIRLGYATWIRARLGWKGLKASEYVDEGYPFLSAFNIVNNKLSWNNLNYINQQRYDESPEIQLSVGDILLVKDGAGIGKCARIDSMPFGDAAPNGSLAVVTPNSDLNYKYLCYYFISNVFRNEMFKIITGMGVPHLTQHFLKNVEIPCPPLSIQEEIITYLDVISGKIDTLIGNKKVSIEDLHEFRNRLVSDTGTGKIDVRDIEIPEYEFTDESADSDSEDADLDVDEEQED